MGPTNYRLVSGNEYERVAAIAKRRIEMIEAWLATNPKEDDVLTWIDV